MTKTDTTTVKQNHDIRDLAGRYTELRRESATELAGPCPKCGGNDRFHCTDTWFMCRQCHPKRGDAIELIRWLHGYGFREAVAKLGGAMPTSPTEKRTPVARPPVATRSPDWERKAGVLVETAHARLWESAGADYLLGRGIEPHVWMRFGLGYRTDAPLPATWDKAARRFVHPPQPAIVMPWFDEAGQVKAVRYRFLQWHEYADAEGKQRREKQTAATGSQFTGLLYGYPGLLGVRESLMTLLLCEGELNALSVWQLHHDAGLDVLSLGSESQHLTPALLERIRRYRRVIVWADKGEIARRLLADIPDAWPVQSPNGQDANDLLQAGLLGGFVAEHRRRAARDAHEREGLLWDLHDASRLPGGLDSGSMQVMAGMICITNI